MITCSFPSPFRQLHAQTTNSRRRVHVQDKDIHPAGRRTSSITTRSYCAHKRCKQKKTGFLPQIRQTNCDPKINLCAPDCCKVDSAFVGGANQMCSRPRSSRFFVHTPPSSARTRSTKSKQGSMPKGVLLSLINKRIHGGHFLPPQENTRETTAFSTSNRVFSSMFVISVPPNPKYIFIASLQDGALGVNYSSPPQLLAKLGAPAADV